MLNKFLKRIPRLFILALLVVSLVLPAIPIVISSGPVFATATVETYYSTWQDFFTDVHNAVYATAHADTTSGSLGYGSSWNWVGQTYYTGDTYGIYRGGVYFDTSALPDNAVVTAAVIKLYGYADQSTGRDFSVTIVDGSALTTPITATSYGGLLSKTVSLGSINTSAGWLTTGYNSIPLNAAGLALISKTGASNFGIRSSLDIATSAPGAGTEEVIGFWSQDKGTGYIPALEVTYTLGQPGDFYPNAHAESTSVDGVVGRGIGAGESWTTQRTGAGTLHNDSETNSIVGIWSSNNVSAPWIQVQRGIILFDTSAIPDTAVISAATLGVYITGKDDSLSITPSFNIYGSTPAANNDLVNADYTQTGTTAYSTAIPYASIVTSDWNVFTLNAAGLAALDITGISKFSLKEATYDAAGGTPAWSSSKTAYIAFDTADNVNLIPYLTVTYSITGGTPTIVTTTILNVRPTTATVVGNISSIGNHSVDQVGVDWGLGPSNYLYGTTFSGTFGTGEVQIPIGTGTPLTQNTRYYYRVKAHNAAGWSYGAEKSIYTLVNSSTWAPYTLAPLFTGGAVVADEDYLIYFGQNIVWIEDQWVMYYDGLPADGHNLDTCIATSRNGIDWVKQGFTEYDPAPGAIPPLGTGAADTTRIYDDATNILHMYYGVGSPSVFKYVNSSDLGATWGTPVTIATNANAEAQFAMIDPVSGNIWDYYCVRPPSMPGPTTTTIWRASGSTTNYSNLSFTTATACTFTGYTDNRPHTIRAWYENGLYYAVWGAWGTNWANTDFSRIYYGTSTNGINWTALSSTYIAKGCKPSVIITANGDHYLYAGTYGYMDNTWTKNNIRGINLWTWISTTPVLIVPTGYTGTAVSLTSSTATLQGSIGSLGDYTPVYVSFDYGTTVGYTQSTTEQTFTTISSVSAPITGLVPNQIYHFRLKLRYGTNSYIYGTDSVFTTPSIPPSSPTSFTASGAGTSIVLNWGKGSESVNTLVRYSDTSVPTSTAEGTSAYFGSLTTYTLSGLTPGTNYYFSAWGENNGVYSAGKVSTSTQPTVGSLVDPDSLSIEDVKVYKDYSQVGSQLYVISYKIVYTAGNPAQDPADYFNLDLWDGALLLARTKVANWGFYPASIYLYTSNMPTWGLDYTVKITGIDSKWTTPPETTYALTSGDWIGSDLTNLDYWIIRHAQSLENYYTTDLTTYTTGSGTRLNDAGGEIYREAIPGLSVVRPDLFSIVVFSVEPDSLDPEGLSQEGQTDLTNNFGATVMAKFTDLGSYMGLSGTAVAGMFWFVILIIVVGIASMATGAPIVGLLIGIPILFIGNYLGCIPLAIMAILSIIAIILTLMQLWLARS